jgi:hypothetical protein
MLDQFQQAFADLTASPTLVLRVRKDPATLYNDYELTDLEWRRLVSIANSPGMERNCMLYRANRLAPVVTYLPETSKLLGDDLRPVINEYWVAFPNTDNNFLIESRRFCDFVLRKIEVGLLPAGDLLAALKRELESLEEK